VHVRVTAFFFGTMVNAKQDRLDEKPAHRNRRHS
jgi:hypothetical protein